MKKKYTFSLDESLIEILREISQRSFRSLSSEVEKALSEYVQKENEFN